MYEFPAPTPVDTDLRILGGTLQVHAEERDTVSVTVEPGDSSSAASDAAAKTRVEMTGNQLLVAAPESKGFRLTWNNAKVNVTVRVPLDSTLTVKTASADVTLHGRYADAKIHSASGEVALEAVTGDVSLNTASGDARIGSVGRSLKINTASGSVRLGDVGGSAVVHSASGGIQLGAVAGDAATNSASGNISIVSVGGSAKANTASGNVSIGAAHAGVTKVNSASGDVRVGVRAGTAVWLDLTTMSGRTSSDLAVGQHGPMVAEGSQLTVQVRTMSGDIDVHRV